MWKSIRTFISLFYLDFYFLLLSLKYTIATEKGKLTILNAKTIFFKKWTDLFLSFGTSWLGSESANLNVKKWKLMKTPQHCSYYGKALVDEGATILTTPATRTDKILVQAKRSWTGLFNSHSAFWREFICRNHFFLIKHALFVECRLHTNKFHFGIILKHNLFKKKNFAVTILMFI